MEEITLTRSVRSLVKGNKVSGDHHLIFFIKICFKKAL